MNLKNVFQNYVVDLALYIAFKCIHDRGNVITSLEYKVDGNVRVT